MPISIVYEKGHALSFELTREDGKFLIQLPRTTVKEYLQMGKRYFLQKRHHKSFLSTAASS